MTKFLYLENKLYFIILVWHKTDEILTGALINYSVINSLGNEERNERQLSTHEQHHFATQNGNNSSLNKSFYYRGIQCIHLLLSKPLHKLAESSGSYVWSFLLVSEEEQLDEPNDQQHHAVDLRHGERPLHPVNVVEEFVRKRRAALFGRDPLVDHRDDHRGEDQVKTGVEEGDDRLPPLHGQTVDLWLRHGDLYVIIMPSYPLPKAPLCVLVTWGVDRTCFPAGRRGATLHARVQIVRVPCFHELLWSHWCLCCPSTDTAPVVWGFYAAVRGNTEMNWQSLESTDVVTICTGDRACISKQVSLGCIQSVKSAWWGTGRW